MSIIKMTEGDDFEFQRHPAAKSAEEQRNNRANQSDHADHAKAPTDGHQRVTCEPSLSDLRENHEPGEQTNLFQCDDKLHI